MGFLFRSIAKTGPFSTYNMNITTDYNIVLLPSTDLTRHIITASLGVSSQADSFFTLQQGCCYPHVSLYMLRLDRSVHNQPQMILDKLGNEFAIVSMKAEKYCYARGYMDIEYSPTDMIRNVQDKVLDAFQPIRNITSEDDELEQEPMGVTKKQYYAAYGYPNIKELFRPHVTLTRYKSDSFRPVHVPPIEAWHGSFDKIALCERGAHGTSIKVVHSVTLH